MIWNFFKANEDKTHKADDKLRQVFKSNFQFLLNYLENFSNISLLVTDKDLIIKYANKSFQKIINLSDVEGKSLKVFLQPHVKNIPIPEDGKFEKLTIHLKCRKPDVSIILAGYVLAYGNRLIFFLEITSYNNHELYEKISHLNNEIARLTRECQKKEKFIETLKSEIQETNRRDSLTGAFNRTYFCETLDKELSRVKRYGIPLSLVLFDIKNFKDIIQSHGRTAGDTVLRQFSNLLIESTRIVDMVFRFEDTSFIILLPNTNIEGAIIVSKKVEIKINSHFFEQNIGILLKTAAVECNANDTTESVIDKALNAIIN